MLRSKDLNEEEALKLDDFFRESLAYIKPYVQKLTSLESAHVCKVWLDKLSISSSQRYLRNEYLAELCRQLQTGEIGGIFSRRPPNGPLLPLPKSYYAVCISSSISDSSDYAAKSRCFESPNKCVQQDRQRRRVTLDHHRKIAEKNQAEIYESFINKLSTLIAELQMQNEYLKTQLLEYQECNSDKMDNHLFANVTQLTADVATLKSKLTDTQKLKDFLETNQKEIVQQYHRAIVEQIDGLKRQVQESHLKNKALENSVTLMADKLEKFIYGMDEEARMLEKQYTDKLRIICQRYSTLTEEKSKELDRRQELLDRRDLELSHRDIETKEEIRSLTNKIQDLEMKFEMRIKDEGNLQVMFLQQYATMKEEFTKMISDKDERQAPKIATLKKAIVKLEKSKERLGSDYEKKIADILKNKELEIKALQLQLQEQKNELCTSLSSEKQWEINNIVCQLEKQYKTILAHMQEENDSKNREYILKITALEEQLISLQKH